MRIGKTRSVVPWAAAGSVAALLAVSPVQAGDVASAAADAVPLAKVMQKAGERVDGQVYAAELVPAESRYRLRLVGDEGRLWRMTYEADSGEMVEAVRLEPKVEESHRPAAFFGRRTPAGYPEW